MKRTILLLLSFQIIPINTSSDMLKLGKSLNKKEQLGIFLMATFMATVLPWIQNTYDRMKEHSQPIDIKLWNCIMNNINKSPENSSITNPFYHFFEKKTYKALAIQKNNTINKEIATIDKDKIELWLQHLLRHDTFTSYIPNKDRQNAIEQFLSDTKINTKLTFFVKHALNRTFDRNWDTLSKSTP